MTNDSSPLKRSFHILNTILFLLVITFLLDQPFLPLYLRRIISTPASTLFIVLLHIPFKVYLFSGIYGTLIEIASEERVTFSVSRLKRNANEYWPYYFVLSAFPVLIYCALFSFFSKINIPLMLIPSRYSRYLFSYNPNRQEKIYKTAESAKKKDHLKKQRQRRDHRSLYSNHHDLSFISNFPDPELRPVDDPSFLF